MVMTILYSLLMIRDVIVVWHKNNYECYVEAARYLLNSLGHRTQPRRGNTMNGGAGPSKPRWLSTSGRDQRAAE